MPDQEPLAPLLAVLANLESWLQAANVPGIVIGGVAASILGRPRLTRDVDATVLVDEARWPGFLAQGEQFGFVPRLSDALEFARESRVLLVRHHPSQIDVDLVFAGLPFEEEAIGRGRSVTIGDVTIRLPSAEDFVVMKAIAHRSRDLIDIEAVLETNPRLDRRKVLRWVREFSSALDAPDLLHDLVTILDRHPRQKS